MPMRLFVGNIPHGLEEAGLLKTFEDAGAIVTNPKILRDRETGNSRGFGFVDVPDGAVIPQAASLVVMGRTLRIEMAQVQERRAAPPMVLEHSEGRGLKPERPGRGLSRGRDVGDRW